MAKTRGANGGNSGVSPVRGFATARAWENWLAKNFATSRGLWLRLAKKGSGSRSVSYMEALDLALCYGWITGQARSDTDKTWLAQFLPRSESSVWSKINREKAKKLIESGRMKPAGLEAVARARRNGQWDRAYDSPRTAAVPPELQAALDANPRARDFFAALDGANRYAILYRIQTAKKSATRERKIRQFVEMLERRETIHPPRPTANRGDYTDR
jgi:uncharacterized protein YdeI (YjbR/CyaY-like superfamily)